MKVVHVLKKIEMIDSDIKELRKLEKSVAKNKSFSTPIYMSIEKQINIMLGERIKLLNLKIDNPPEEMVSEFDAPVEEQEEESENKAKPVKKAKAVTKKKKQKSIVLDDDFDVDDEMPMLTQDLIDQKIKNIKSEKEEKTTKPKPKKQPKTVQVKKPEPKSKLKPESDVKVEVEVEVEEKNENKNDDNIKLLDIALEKGSLGSKESDKDKKVRFFRENFPVD